MSDYKIKLYKRTYLINKTGISQFTGNATALQSYPIAAVTPQEAQLLQFTSGMWQPTTLVILPSLLGSALKYARVNAAEEAIEYVQPAHSELSGIGTLSHAQLDAHVSNTLNPHQVTAAQVGNATAQWNANQIQGIPVDNTDIAIGKSLQYDGTKLTYVPSVVSTFTALSDTPSTYIGSPNRFVRVKATSDGLIFADATKSDVGLSNLDNVQQMPLSYLDTDPLLAADSDTRVASQKALKAYIPKSFTALGDTPASYLSQANKFVRVKADESGLEFLGLDPLHLRGNWDADTNTPDITGETDIGGMWIVSVAGTTDLGGITDWQVNDYAIKTTTGWAKVDNTELGYWTRDALNSLLYPTNTDNLKINGNAGNDLPLVGPQLITAGDAWTSTGWTDDWATGWKHIADNVDVLSHDVPATIGVRYYAQVVISERTTSGCTITFGGMSVAANGNGTFAIAGLATTTDSFKIIPTLSTWNGRAAITLFEYTTEVTPYLHFGDRMQVRSPLYAGSNSSTFFGGSSGMWCSGRQNTGYGLEALQEVTVGAFNSCFGYEAGWQINIGIHNTVMGRAAARNMTTGNYNVVIGSGTMNDHVSGSENTVVGNGAYTKNVAGVQNAVYGGGGLALNVLGNYNSSLGYKAGYKNLGSGNLFLGYQAGYAETGSNKLYVANSATSTPLIYGEFDNALLRVNGTLTCPGVGVNSEKFGVNADATGTSSTAIGVSAKAVSGTSTSVGLQSGFNVTGGDNNTFVGVTAGSGYAAHSKSRVSAYGYQSGRFNQGSDNCFFGMNTGMGPNAAGNSAANNCFFGTYAGGLITSALSNVGVGYAAGQNLTTGSRNVLIGLQAGATLTTESDRLIIANSNTVTPLIYGEFNTPLLRITGLLHVSTGSFQLDNTAKTTQYGVIYKGADRFIHNFNWGVSGAITTAGENTFVGVNSGNFTMGSTATAVAEASYNTGVGVNVLTANTKGGSNTSVGHGSMASNTTGTSNSVLGRNALNANTTGSSNVAVGLCAMLSGTTGSDNVAIGANALRLNGSQSYNVAVGSQALYTVSGGSNNVAIGYQALYSSISGAGNVAIGYQAGYNEIGSNKLYIANSPTITPLIYGEFDTPSLTINAPTSVVGNLTLSGASRTLYVGTTQSACAISIPRLGTATPMTMTTTGTGMNIANCNHLNMTDASAIFQAPIGRFVRLHTANSYTYLYQIDHAGAVSGRYSRVGFGHDSITENTPALGYYVSFFGGLANDLPNVLFKQSAVQTADLTHWKTNADALVLGIKTTGAIYNIANSIKFDSEINLKQYAQDTEPVLAANGNMAIWIDTDDSNKVYFLYRRGAGDQVAVELS
jgi:hypothetical protein